MNNRLRYIEDSIFYVMIGYIFTIIFEIKEITDTLLVLMIILSGINIYYKKISLKDLPNWIKWALGSMIISSIILIFFLFVFTLFSVLLNFSLWCSSFCFHFLLPCF